jgi:hypothetical protein
MPKNTACKVVMSFRSLDVTNLKKISLCPPIGCRANIRCAQRSPITFAYRVATNVFAYHRDSKTREAAVPSWPAPASAATIECAHSVITARQREPKGFDFVDNHTPRHEACFHKILERCAFLFFRIDFFYPYGATMTDEQVARLRAHDNNVSRYRWLLKTNLSELERRFLERRLSEEMSAIESLAKHPVSTASVGIADQFETGAF